jgi:transcriptional regulator with XRE-family HTH domain
MSMLKLGKLLMERRGGTGVREFAKFLGISPATLSRVEHGHLPDIETFSKICDRLGLDPSEFLQITKQTENAGPGSASVHFRADVQLTPSAARDLAQLIIAAQKHVAARR